MRFWDWLLRRKRKPPKPASDAEAVRLAVAELGRRHAHNKKKGWVREIKVEADRQIVLTGQEPPDISQELLTLTADTYLHRRLYGSEEQERQDLTQAEGGAQAATTASADALKDMKQKKIKPREHYYRLAERQATGEIQETFLIDEEALKAKPADAP